MSTIPGNRSRMTLQPFSWFKARQYHTEMQRLSNELNRLERERLQELLDSLVDESPVTRVHLMITPFTITTLN